MGKRNLEFITHGSGYVLLLLIGVDRWTRVVSLCLIVLEVLCSLPIKINF